MTYKLLFALNVGISVIGIFVLAAGVSFLLSGPSTTSYRVLRPFCLLVLFAHSRLTAVSKIFGSDTLRTEALGLGLVPTTPTLRKRDYASSMSLCVSGWKTHGRAFERS
jgi:hypothetical protein